MNDLEYGAPVGGVALHETTAEQRASECARLSEKYRRELAVGLMSDGAVSPTQVSRMGKAAFARWQRDGQVKMVCRSRMASLRRSDADIRAEWERAQEKKRQGQIEQTRRDIAMWRTFGMSSKTGKLRPKYARAIAQAETELAALVA